MKNKFLLVQLLATLLLFSCHTAKQNTQKYNIESVASSKGTAVFQDNWDSMRKSYKFPTWFQDAKFGIFIHWGVYSVPAFGTEWYARLMYTKDSDAYQHHLKTYGNHETFGYKDFIPMFTASKFNADEWAALFKESGAKYVVPVAEHHDGFSMYDSELNPWNAAKMGPKRDVLGLLKKSIQKEGLVFGLSTHRAENAWFYGGGMEFPSDVKDTTITLYGERLERNKVNTRFMKNYLKHTYELIEKYKPELIWFDWTVNSPGIMPYFNKFMAHYYNTALDWGKEVVVNTKYGYPKDIMVWDVERGKSDQLKKYPWQTDTSIGKKSWSFIADEENKTPKQLVRDLVDIVSKNGNLLLNVGPRADGSITEEQQSVLRGIGQWLKVNGEAIYGSRTWVRYGEGHIKEASGAFTDSQAAGYTADDIRFTTKGNMLYATAMDWTNGKICISSLGNKTTQNIQVKKVTMLGSNETIEWILKDAGLEIQFPKEKPCEHAYVFKIELSGFAFGNVCFEINKKNQLEVSQFIYSHTDSSQKLNIEIDVDGNKFANHFVEVKPALRNEFTCLLNDIPNGYKKISIKKDSLALGSYAGLFPTNNMVDNWSFHRGDCMDWRGNINEQDWENVVTLPQDWETHSGYEGTHCYGWYRKSLEIPVEWKDYQLCLPLGKLKDVAEIFLNGHSIGKFGKFPPAYQPSTVDNVVVRLPHELIHFGGKNWLAVRVYCDQVNGGFVGGNIQTVQIE